MHLLKAMSSSVGVDPTTPFLKQEYYPLEVKKYVTFQPHSKYESKNYPFWADVLKMVGNQLNTMGIAVVQLGGEGEFVHEGVCNLSGKTTVNQAAYVIQNGIMHFGADSWMAHFAGFIKKPVLALYGNNYIRNVKPYWHEDFIGLDGFKDDKPCFSEIDPDKSIHNITPDEIAMNICSLLKIKFEFPFKTFWTGKNHAEKRIDIVPNQVLKPETFKVAGYIIRMDLLHNEDILFKQLQECPCIIVTKKPIDTRVANFKKHIQEFAYDISCAEDAEYIEFLHKMGFNYYLTSELPDEELDKIKIHFMDFKPIIKIEKHKPAFLELEKPEDLFFESKKVLLSNQKVFLCEAALKANRPVHNLHSIQQFEKQFINEILYKEINNLRFFKKI